MSKWFERTPELLERESKQLQSSTTYIEEFQKRGNLFVSSGHFIIRINGKKLTYSATFVYPEATPYSLPRVFLTESNLLEDEVEEISNSPEKTISSFFKLKAKFYFLRHQSFDGSLCLLENDNYESDEFNFFEVKDIIGRVQKWLIGITTGVLPKDTIEVELHNHFPNQKFINILFPQEFYNEKLLKGEFYLRVDNLDENDHPFLLLGACIEGESKTGLFLESATKEYPLMPEGLNTREKLARNSELLSEEIENKNILKGYWWELENEPEIFPTTVELAESINNLTGAISNEFYLKIWPQLKKLDQQIYVGLRFLNRRNEEEWLVLILEKARNENFPIMGSEDNAHEVIKDYDVYAAKSEKFSEESFFLRNAGRVQEDKVKSETISFLGCGALGSEIADCLCKAGVGKIYLNDNQLLYAHNAVRHLAGVSKTGYYKVQAVSQILKDHNPFVKIEANGYNVFLSSLNQTCGENGIIVSTIADDNTESFINQQAADLKRTVFYSRALRGGKAARIFKVEPGKDACFYCLSLYRHEKDSLFFDVPEDFDFPTIRNECNNPIRPGSGADLKLISSITARIILDFLHGEPKPPCNHWIWTSEPDLVTAKPDNLPFSLLESYIPPHKECPVCKPFKATIKIKEPVLDFMRNLTIKTPGIETGGILIGKVDSEGNFIIEFASEPGSDSIRSASRFERDNSFCQSILDEWTQKGFRYLGEWHSHPTDDNSPSKIDKASLKKIAQQKEYLTDRPIMIIWGKNGIPACTIHYPDGSYSKVELEIVN